MPHATNRSSHVRRRRSSITGASVALLAIPAVFVGAARAQQPPADQTPGQSTAQQEGALQEVVVTAQFRSQNLQNTPLAITAITAAQMEARSQATVMDVANTAPNVVFSLGGGGLGGGQATSITIRGIGQNDFNLATEPGVGMYLDDVYYGTMYGSMFELIDLDRVEILRGPQGTLQGKDSEGGAVKLFSTQPGAETNGYAEFTTGQHQLREVRAGSNFTLLPDTLFLRVTGFGKEQQGFVTRLDYQCVTGLSPVQGTPPAPYFAPGSGELGGPAGCEIGREGGTSAAGVRAALRWMPTDGINNVLTYDATRDNSDPPPTILFYQGTWHGPGYNLLTTPPNPLPAQNFVPPAGSYYNFGTFTGLAGTPWQYQFPAVDNINSWGIANNLQVQLPLGVKLTSITAYRDLHQISSVDSDVSPFDRVINGWNVDYSQFTQELRFSGAFSHWLDWTVGGYHFDSNALQGGRISLDGAGDNLIPFFVTTDFLFNDPVHVRSNSGFMNLEFHATDALTFTGGVRYTTDYKSYMFGRYTAPGYPPSIIDESILGTNGAVGVYSGDHTDWRFTAAYEIDPTLNVYAEAATGFKGGGINGRPYYLEQVLPVNPETVKSYEIGMKSDWFDRRVRVNLAAFYNNYNEMQLTLFSCPQYVPPGAPQNCALPANVGNANIKGAELEAQARPVDNLLINASASYLNFRFTSVDPATGIVLSDKPPFTPKYKANAGVQYDFTLGSRGSLTPRFDYSYVTEQWSEVLNEPHGRIAPYGLGNVRLTYRDARDHWEVAFRITNLFDKYYYLTTVDNTPPVTTPPSYDYAAAIVGEPREWAVTVKRRF